MKAKQLIDFVQNETRLSCRVGLAIVGAMTIAGFAATLHPYLDWFASFRHLYVVAAGVAALLMFRSAPCSAGVAVAILTINAAALVPWTPVLPKTCEPDATAMTINAWGGFSDHDELMRRIDDAAPEILWISELTPELLERASAAYPHRVWTEHAPGIGLFTNFPVRSHEVQRSPRGRASINVVLETPRGELRVLGAHTMAPGIPWAAEDRNAALQQLAAAAEVSAEPVVLLGDLNITMYSPHYKPLETAGLRNARLARGVAGTWPAYFPVQIPIDHVLASRELTVCEMEVGETFESDHLPLIARFAWDDKPTPRVALR